jgi:hypothetical protein
METKFNGNLKPVTIKSYKTILGTLSEKIWKTREINVENFLKYEEVVPELMKMKESTRGKTLTSICNFLKGHDEEIRKKYKKLLVETAISIKNEKNKQLKSEREEKNWVKMEELEDLLNIIDKELDEADTTKITTREHVILWTKYVALALYLLQPPLRCDYADMLIHRKEDGELPRDKNNYYDMERRKFILREYKNNKFYGDKEIDIENERLIEILEQWCEEVNTTNWLIIISNRMGNKNAITKSINTAVGYHDFRQMSKSDFSCFMTSFIKSRIGKSVGPQIIRKVFLSEKFPVTSTAEEHKLLAEKMCHSVTTQQQVYRKKTD